MEALNHKDKKIAVLCGGRSGEREVSLRSGTACYDAFLRKGYDVRLIDIADDGALLDIVTQKPDIAFLALHGKGGEDGTIQGYLETLGIPYTGSGILASALAINKSRTKDIYRQNNLPTPDSLTFVRSDFDTSSEKNTNYVSQLASAAKTIVEKCGLPCVIKPTTEGSSLGMTIAKKNEDVISGLELALRVDREVIVEEFISGTELTVGVMGYENPQPFAPIQINVTSEEFYNFEAKYATGGSTHICPAPVADKITQIAQKMAVAAHKALGCGGVSRTDMILDDAGNLYLLETNTIPGMTETSLIPDAAAEAGIPFDDLCEKVLFMALSHNKVLVDGD
ncbi:MAG: D-alanine--D-alanine ligase [Eggerthellaceae bacterium]|nr:D-alanine--D-alanine ligase [Eggerthellaceae bacterium]